MLYALIDKYVYITILYTKGLEFNVDQSHDNF